jgi:alpha-beta hydrolase superfamily lysophospholipase
MSKITSKNRRRRLLVIAFIVLLTGWLASSYAVARYFVSRRSAAYVETVPTVTWAKFAEQRLKTSDDQTIGCWHTAGSANQPIVILVHGHMGNRSAMLSRAKLFAELGCGTMLLTMRAHGDSTGTLNDFGYGGRLDVIAAVEFLEKTYPGRKILLVGCSAGATAVCGAGSELGNRVHGIVMEQPFRDMYTVVKQRTDLFLPPVLSHVAYAGLILMGNVVLPHYSQIAPIQLAQKIAPQVKVWILTGGKDNRADPSEGKSIYDAIQSHADLYCFPDAGHESLLEHDKNNYTKHAQKWVDELTQMRK